MPLVIVKGRRSERLQTKLKNKKTTGEQTK